MELHNHAVYNEDVIARMFCFQFFKPTKRLGLFNLVWIPLMIAGGIALIVMEILNMLPSLLPFYIGIFLLTLGIVFVILMMKIRKAAKENPSVAHFVFYDDRLEASVSNTDVKTGSTFFYQNLFRVYETKNCFYLYIDKKQAYLIVKDGFSDTKDAIALREKLMSVLGKKYKNYT